jgi:IS30 family transposase
LGAARWTIEEAVHSQSNSLLIEGRTPAPAAAASQIVTLLERQTRYVMMAKVDSKE